MAPTKADELGSFGKRHCLLNPAYDIRDPRLNLGNGEVVNATCEDNDIEIRGVRQ